MLGAVGVGKKKAVKPPSKEEFLAENYLKKSFFHFLDPLPPSTQDPDVIREVTGVGPILRGVFEHAEPKLQIFMAG